MSNIFNNIKVLTDLEVKNAATMKSGLVVSGTVSGTTGIRVKEDAVIDGQLIVGGNVVNQGYAQIGALVVDGVTDINGNLIITGSQFLTGDLNVNGTTNLTGTLAGNVNIGIVGSVSASNNVSASTGTYGTLTAGTISVNSLYLPGNLGVSGSTTLGQNGSSVVTSVAQFTASNGVEASTNGFNASNGTGYKLHGTEVLKSASGVPVFQSGSLNKIQLGNLGYGGEFSGKEGIKSSYKDVNILVGPRILVKTSEAANPIIDITSSYSKIYSIGGDVRLSGSDGINAESSVKAKKSLQLSGSGNFLNITSVTRDGDGLYNVDDAIHALDAIINTTDNNYAKMRFASSGSISAGSVSLDLVTAGADSTFFGVSQLNYLVADVMVRTSNTSPWSNDLLSVYLYEDNGSLKLDIDVPAASTGWEYRLIIVNENGNMFV